ncbi:MAG: hypothetical protein U0Q18_23980 [Bryobacteraceae bacterium]
MSLKDIPKIPFAARILPSMTDLAFIMPLVFLFRGLKGTQTLLSDGDTGWHLRTGEWILAHRQVPHEDLFSFTRPHQPWFAWEWLWDLIFGWLHLHAGMAGVLAVNCLVLALTFALLFRLSRWKCGDALIALLLTLAAAAGSAGHWLARPHLFTMLFTVLFFGVLERVRAGARRQSCLWVLPPLMILWTNLHGGFFVGIVLIAGYAAGEFALLMRRGTGDRRSEALRTGGHYLAIAAACGLATLVNPYFHHLHLHIWQYLSDDFFRNNILEFQSANFQSGQAPFFELLLLAGAAAAFGRLREWRLEWPLLFVLWAHLSLYSARNIEIFVLLSAPHAAETATRSLGRIQRWAWAEWLERYLAAFTRLREELTLFDRMPRWHVASVAAVLVVSAIMRAPGAPERCRPEYDPKSFPAAAVAELDHLSKNGRVFTQDLWGGYLIYRRYPEAGVFIDGRSDFYGADFTRQYVRILAAQAGWQKQLKRYGVDSILLPPDAALAGVLRESRSWRLEYQDHAALIFRSGTEADNGQDCTGKANVAAPLSKVPAFISRSMR